MSIRTIDIWMMVMGGGHLCHYDEPQLCLPECEVTRYRCDLRMRRWPGSVEGGRPCQVCRPPGSELATTRCSGCHRCRNTLSRVYSSRRSWHDSGDRLLTWSDCQITQRCVVIAITSIMKLPNNNNNNNNNNVFQTIEMHTWNICP